MEKPQFKDVLRDLLGRNSISFDSTMEEVSYRLRTQEETLTFGRLRGLLSGMQPSVTERRAISLVLEPVADQWLSENWNLEDLEPRRVARFDFARTGNRTSAKKFVDFVLSEASYRNDVLSDSELAILHQEFPGISTLDEEIDLFHLSA